jgi:protein-tyrosine phosphatase
VNPNPTSAARNPGPIPGATLGPAVELKAMARRAYRAVRHVPERLLHGYRHRIAVERRTRAGRPARVLILCYGNICRSPYAEARLRALLARRRHEGVFVESAGFFGPGRLANEMAQHVAQARLLDLSSHRSRVVDRTLAASATLILVMTPGQASALVRQVDAPASRVEVLGDLDPQGILQRDIPDPYGQAAEVFEQVFDRIDRCLDVLIRTW